MPDRGEDQEQARRENREKLKKEGYGDDAIELIEVLGEVLLDEATPIGVFKRVGKRFKQWAVKDILAEVLNVIRINSELHEQNVTLARNANALVEENDTLVGENERQKRQIDLQAGKIRELEAELKELRSLKDTVTYLITENHHLRNSTVNGSDEAKPG